jgi:hypothetical protein
MSVNKVYPRSFVWEQPSVFVYVSVLGVLKTPIVYSCTCLQNPLYQHDILKENLVQSAFQQTLGDEFPFQKENNLKHKVKSMPESLIKTTLNDPKWPSYSFDLNRLENL